MPLVKPSGLGQYALRKSLWSIAQAWVSVRQEKPLWPSALGTDQYALKEVSGQALRLRSVCTKRMPLVKRSGLGQYALRKASGQGFRL